MLKRLEIKDFKSIAVDALDFGRANLFIGPNGSGKSNLLEALGLLAAALSKGLDPSNLDGKGVRLSLPRFFKSAFKNQRLPAVFSLTAHFEHGTYYCAVRASDSSSSLEFQHEELTEGGRKVFGRSPRGKKVHGEFGSPEFADARVPADQSFWSVIGPFCQISEEFRAELESLSSYSIYAPQTAIMRGLATDSRVIEPLGLTGSRLALAFQEALSAPANRKHGSENLSKILQVIWAPGWADSISIGAYDPEKVPAQVRSEGQLLYIRDKYMNTARNMLSPYDASEGTLYLIFVATLLAHPSTPRSFALDNIDGTLNPELVERLTGHVVKVCSGESESSMSGGLARQSFMTSHHPASLDAMDIFSNDQAVFVTSRQDEDGDVIGSTKFRRLLPPKGVTIEEWRLRHAGANLSTLFLEGQIPGARK